MTSDDPTLTDPAKDAQRAARSLSRRMLRDQTYRDTFTSDFDRDIFLHGSSGDRAYNMRPAPATEAEPAVAPTRSMTYEDDDKPSYGG